MLKKGIGLFFVLLFLSSSVFAKDEASKVSDSDGDSDIESDEERADVENIKKKYWALGDEAELGVVQNRIFTKRNKLKMGLFGGKIGTDPFLSVMSAGGTLGYYFSEYFALQALVYKAFTSKSTAYATLRSQGLDTSTNNLNSFYGIEGNASPVYGKLSLLGEMIIYYDLYFLLGAGFTSTYYGNYFTPSIGVGQLIYLNKFWAVNMDFRYMPFSETLPGVGSRANHSTHVSLGLTFLLGKV